MRSTRRTFIRTSAAAGAGLLLAARVDAYDYQSPGVPIPGQHWPGMAKFAMSLRGVGPGGIPVAMPDAVPGFGGASHYTLRVTEFVDTLHPSLGPTTLRGYSPAMALGEGAYPTRHLGGLIVAQKGVPVQLTFTNVLPAEHTLPVDVSTPMLGGFADAAGRFGGSGFNAITPHLHGGFVPWVSDGGPNAWFTPDGHAGPTLMRAFMQTLNPALLPNQGEYYYPNQQSARMLWYHDHARDITRLNAYAGLATAYIIRDAFEGNLRNLGVPDFVENGGREIPLVIQDKIFVGPHIDTLDPTWAAVTSPKSQTVGSLWYPHVYEENGRKATSMMPDPSCVPEMFGDTMLVNGTVYPVATIEARRYRFRVLNACQGRFLNLQLYIANTKPDGISYDHSGRPVNPKGPDFLVLGTEGGFLPHPVLVPSNQPFDAGMLTAGAPTMITAPAERWDLLIDFAGLAGQRVILYNDAPAPFPAGDDSTDFYADDRGRVSTKPGYGPDTRILMRFDIVAAAGADAAPGITAATDMTPGLDPFLVSPGVAVQDGVLNLPPGIAVRQLTLNETFDSLGRLIQLLGTNTPGAAIAGSYGRQYGDTATETPLAGTTEIWQIANLSADTHPVHFHLVNVQVLARQPFDVRKYAGTPRYTGAARSPDPTELGWKETVRMNPGEVTTVIMRFDLPPSPIAVPASPLTGGHEYVWHCHILEHEEHDMMRPFVVL